MLVKTSWMHILGLIRAFDLHLKHLRSFPSLRPELISRQHLGKYAEARLYLKRLLRSSEQENMRVSSYITWMLRNHN
jgi:hypothetical protein